MPSDRSLAPNRRLFAGDENGLGRRAHQPRAGMLEVAGERGQHALVSGAMITVKSAARANRVTDRRARRATGTMLQGPASGVMRASRVTVTCAGLPGIRAKSPAIARRIAARLAGARAQAANRQPASSDPFMNQDPDPGDSHHAHLALSGHTGARPQERGRRPRGRRPAR